MINQSSPAPDQQERTTAIALLLNKLVLAAHARGYQEGREHIHEDDRITGKEVDDIERKILEQAQRLEADLTAVRAQLEDKENQCKGLGLRVNELQVSRDTERAERMLAMVDTVEALGQAGDAEAALTALRAQLHASEVCQDELRRLNDEARVAYDALRARLAVDSEDMRWIAHQPFCAVMGQDARFGWRIGDETLCNCGLKEAYGRLRARLAVAESEAQKWKTLFEAATLETR